MFSEETYGAVITYVKKTLDGIGAIAGAPCEIASIENEDGEHTINFSWRDNEGTEHTSSLLVKDGESPYQIAVRNGFEGTESEWLATLKATGDYITPQMFGALADGVHDDTEAIQSALNEGGVIYFSRGVYIVSDTLDIKSNTVIRGDGINTIIKIIDTVDSEVSMLRTGWNSERYNIEIDDITLRGAENYGSAQGGICMLDIHSAHNVTIRNSIFQNNQYSAIRLISSETIKTHHITVENCRFEATDIAVCSLGNYPVDDVTVRNCYFSGKSSINEFTHYQSEQIGTYTNGDNGCSYRWLVENCTIEYKDTNAIVLGHSEVAPTDKTKKLIADSVVRNITVRNCHGAVYVSYGLNCLVEGVFYDNTDVEESEWSTFAAVISLGAYCEKIKFLNITNDCEYVNNPISFPHATCKEILVDNFISKGGLSSGGFTISGNNIILSNVVFDSITRYTRVVLKNLTNSSIEILSSIASPYRVVFAPDSTATGNVIKFGTQKIDKLFNIDNAQDIEQIPQIYQGTKTDEVAPNKYIDISGFTVRRANIKQINKDYLPTTWSIIFANASTYDTDSSYDTFYLADNGHEMDITLNVSSTMSTKKFSYKATGNIIPINTDEFDVQPASVSTVISHFIQNGTKWIETSRIRNYADGHIVDISKGSTPTNIDFATELEVV